MDDYSKYYKLCQLHIAQVDLYDEFITGNITEDEYIKSIKPLDIAISELEMSILRDTLGWRGSFLPHTQKQGY
jgi:hypothetical protein